MIALKFFQTMIFRSSFHNRSQKAEAKGKRRGIQNAKVLIAFLYQKM